MEYNKLIERMQQTPVEVPDTDAILGGMRRTLHRRRQQRTLLASAVCLLLATLPLTMSMGDSQSTPTLAEAVSATLPSSPNDLPAPLAGYKNSIRNHQKAKVI